MAINLEEVIFSRNFDIMFREVHRIRILMPNYFKMKAHNFLFDFISKELLYIKTTIQNMSWSLPLH
jgi:hypothetical protein